MKIKGTQYLIERISQDRQTWQICRKVSVPFKEAEVMQYGERQHRLRPKWGHRNLPPVSCSDCPLYERISHYGRRRRLKSVQQLLKRPWKLSKDSGDKAREIFGPVALGGDNVGQCGEAEVARRLTRIWIRADESEPLFGDDKGDEDVVSFGE